jgi:DNA-binding LacI/PurR family transcriptional regulator
MIELTTVRADLDVLSRRTVELLRSAIAGDVAPLVERIEPHVVLRATHAPARN